MKTIVIMMVVSFLLLVCSFYSCNSFINQAGGFKNIAIEVGRECKDIARQVENEN